MWSLSTRNVEVAPLTGITQNYSYIVLGNETVAFRRHSCWCNACLYRGRNILIDTRPSASADRTLQTVADVCRVEGCTSAVPLRRLRLALTDATSARKNRKRRFENGESLARSSALQNGAVFATATPTIGYRDSFELFVATDPGDGKSIVRALESDVYIGSDKVRKGRLVIYCRDLQRLDEDEHRRTFVADSTVRIVEARMLRYTGVQLTDAGPAPTPVGVGRSSTRNDTTRRQTISETDASAIIGLCDA